ncbi:MAG: hypothetical protein QM811_09700 [Pirellulales bacterium]
MAVLERMRCQFDYEKVEIYRSKIQEFLRCKESQFPGKYVFFDITQGKATLPVGLDERIEIWMSNHPDYSPFMRTFARNYLISLLEDYGNKNPYELLAQCVIQGGDFYLESGFIYLRDAAAISTFV